MNEMIKSGAKQVFPVDHTANTYQMGHVAVPTRPVHEKTALAANFCIARAEVNLHAQSERAEPGPDQLLMGIDELRSFNGCKHYGDQKAAAVLESLHTLAQVLVDTFVFTPIRSEAA